MVNKKTRTTFYKHIWCMVRNWQRINNVSESELASYFKVNERTLKEYDKSAHHVTLEKLDNFLDMTGLDLNDLMHYDDNDRQNFNSTKSYSQVEQFFKWDKHIK